MAIIVTVAGIHAADSQSFREPTLYYFAYGLDISRKQMRQMCPDAKPASTALLPHYKLVFIGWDRKWRSGTANIQYNRGSRVMGVIYDVSERDLRRRSGGGSDLPQEGPAGGA